MIIIIVYIYLFYFYFVHDFNYLRFYIFDQEVDEYIHLIISGIYAIFAVLYFVSILLLIGVQLTNLLLNRTTYERFNAGSLQ